MVWSRVSPSLLHTVSPLPVIYGQERQSSAALLFLLAAVAVLFLVAHAAVMSFRVLETFGMPPIKIRALLRGEIAAVFLAPGALAVLHSLFAVVDWVRTLVVGTVLRFHPLWTPLQVWAGVAGF